MVGPRGTKLLSRIRSGGVVISRARLAKELQADPSANVVAFRKLRIAGLPNRRAASLKLGAKAKPVRR